MLIFNQNNKRNKHDIQTKILIIMTNVLIKKINYKKLIKSYLISIILFFK